MSQAWVGPGLKNLRFLVIDDHAQLRMMLRTILRTLGARDIIEAPEGGEGIKLTQENHPDIIITDWAMEPMDGIEMVKTLRQSNEDKIKYVPIIMLTGFSERARIIAARDSGINEYLLKPIVPKMLYSRIRAVIEQPRRFVKTDIYFGPDRRRGDQQFEGPDKRGTGESYKPVDMKEQMTQQQIEDEYFMPTASGSVASAEQYIPPGLRKAQELARKNRR